MAEDDQFPGNDIAIRQMWYRMARIEAKQDTTNGRVSKLEKFQWFVTGGLMVLAIVVVPLVVRIITGTS